MARPPQSTPKAKLASVSLYPHHKAKLDELGGSGWLQAKLDQAIEAGATRISAEGGISYPSTILRVECLSRSMKNPTVMLRDLNTKVRYGPYSDGDQFEVDLFQKLSVRPMRGDEPSPFVRGLTIYPKPRKARKS